jgi:hypothetical protein
MDYYVYNLEPNTTNKYNYISTGPPLAIVSECHSWKRGPDLEASLAAEALQVETSEEHCAVQLVWQWRRGLFAAVSKNSCYCAERFPQGMQVKRRHCSCSPLPTGTVV